MPLSWNEIKSRAHGFSREWQHESSEDAEAKSFWDGFFNIFGISRKRLASFEEPVRKLGDKQGFIDLFWKGVRQSAMHMAWLGTVGGRLKSDFQYSGSMVYNTFPWPQTPSSSPLSGGERSGSSPDKGRPGGVKTAAIETAAQAILDARALYMPPSPAGGRGAGGEGAKVATLADLYDPLTMPPALLKAHQALDKAVDAAYGKTSFKTEAERVAFLFERYQKLTSLLPAAPSGKGEKTRGKKG